MRNGLNSDRLSHWHQRNDRLHGPLRSPRLRAANDQHKTEATTARRAESDLTLYRSLASELPRVID